MPKAAKVGKAKADPPFSSADRNDWHCSICMQLKSPLLEAYESSQDPSHQTSTVDESLASSPAARAAEASSVLISCDGVCLRSYHAGCFAERYPHLAPRIHEIIARGESGTDSNGASATDEPWLCPDCEADNHACAICVRYDETPGVDSPAYPEQRPGETSVAACQRVAAHGVGPFMLWGQLASVSDPAWLVGRLPLLTRAAAMASGRPVPGTVARGASSKGAAVGGSGSSRKRSRAAALLDEGTAADADVGEGGDASATVAGEAPSSVQAGQPRDVPPEAATAAVAVSLSRALGPLLVELREGGASTSSEPAQLNAPGGHRASIQGSGSGARDLARPLSLLHPAEWQAARESHQPPPQGAALTVQSSLFEPAADPLPKPSSMGEVLPGAPAATSDSPVANRADDVATSASAIQPESGASASEGSEAATALVPVEEPISADIHTASAAVHGESAAPTDPAHAPSAPLIELAAEPASDPVDGSDAGGAAADATASIDAAAAPSDESAPEPPRKRRATGARFSYVALDAGMVVPLRDDSSQADGGDGGSGAGAVPVLTVPHAAARRRKSAAAVSQSTSAALGIGAATPSQPPLFAPVLAAGAPPGLLGLPWGPRLGSAAAPASGETGAAAVGAPARKCAHRRCAQWYHHACLRRLSDLAVIDAALRAHSASQHAVNLMREAAQTAAASADADAAGTTSASPASPPASSPSASLVSSGSGDGGNDNAVSGQPALPHVSASAPAFLSLPAALCLAGGTALISSLLVSQPAAAAELLVRAGVVPDTASAVSALAKAGLKAALVTTGAGGAGATKRSVSGRGKTAVAGAASSTVALGDRFSDAAAQAGEPIPSASAVEYDELPPALAAAVVRPAASEPLLGMEPLWLAPGTSHDFLCPRHLCDTCEAGAAGVASLGSALAPGGCVPHSAAQSLFGPAFRAIERAYGSALGHTATSREAAVTAIGAASAPASAAIAIDDGAYVAPAPSKAGSRRGRASLAASAPEPGHSGTSVASAAASASAPAAAAAEYLSGDPSKACTGGGTSLGTASTASYSFIEHGDALPTHSAPASAGGSTPATSAAFAASTDSDPSTAQFAPLAAALLRSSPTDKLRVLVVESSRAPLVRRLLASRPLSRHCLYCPRAWHAGQCEQEYAPHIVTADFSASLCPVHAPHRVPGESPSEHAQRMGALRPSLGPYPLNGPLVAAAALAVGPCDEVPPGSTVDPSLAAGEGTARLLARLGSPDDMLEASQAAAARLSGLPGFPHVPLGAVSDAQDWRHMRIAESLVGPASTKMPPYTHIKRNSYQVKVRPELHESDVCACADNAARDAAKARAALPGGGDAPAVHPSKPQCDASCYNRLLRVECMGGGEAVTPDGAERSTSKGGREVSNTRTICSIGPGCGNRAIRDGVSPPLVCKPVSTLQRAHKSAVYALVAFYELAYLRLIASRPSLLSAQTPGKGWGVFAGADIPAGSFVIEYVGEIIDEAMQVRVSS